MKKKPSAKNKTTPSKVKVYPSILDDERNVSKVSEIDMSGTYSYADYLSWKFDDRLELIKGKVFKMSPAPSTTHQRFCGLLNITLSVTLECSACELFISPFDVRLPEKSAADEDIYTVVQPDICIVCDKHKIDERGCIGAPDLMIEILSKGNNKRDLIDKFDLYEESGVREYWIIHPIKKFFYIYCLDEHRKYKSKGENFYYREVESFIFSELKFNLGELYDAKIQAREGAQQITYLSAAK